MNYWKALDKDDKVIILICVGIAVYFTFKTIELL